MDQKKISAIILTFLVFTSVNFVLAQNLAPARKDAVKTSASNDSQAGSDDFVELLRKDIRSQKKQIIAENMGLSDGEAEKFWPVYDQYAGELSKIYDVKLGLLKNYADSYNSMTGEQAEDYIRKRGEAEQSIMQLRLKYIPAFRKVLTGREVALTCSWYKCRSSIRNRPTHFPCCYRVLPMRPIDRPRSFFSMPAPIFLLVFAWGTFVYKEPEDKSSCMDARSEREYNNRR